MTDLFPTPREVATRAAARNATPSQPTATRRVRPRRVSEPTRQLSWWLGAVGVVLIGQANEFSYAYFDNGNLFSVPVFAMSIIILLYGLRLQPGLRVGLPFGLLTAVMIYTLAVGTICAAAVSPLETIWSDASRIVRAAVLFVCVFTGAQALLRSGRFGQLAIIFTWVAAAIVAYQVVAYLLGHQPTIRDTFEGETFRYSGVFGNPNQAARFCNLLVCVALLAPLSGKTKSLILGLAFAGLLVTFSRGGIVAFTAVMMANVMIGNVRGRLVFALALGAAATAALLVVPLLVQGGAMPDGMAKHSIALYELVNGEISIADTSRGVLNKQTLVLIQEHPLSGLGLGQYYSKLGMMGSHNMYTHLALLAGIPAATVYVAAIATLGWQGFLLTGQSERRFVVSIAVSMAVQGFSSHNLLDEKHFVLLVAIACAIAQVQLASTGAAKKANCIQGPTLAT